MTIPPALLAAYRAAVREHCPNYLARNVVYRHMEAQPGFNPSNDREVKAVLDGIDKEVQEGK